ICGHCGSVCAVTVASLSIRPMALFKACSSALFILTAPPFAWERLTEPPFTGGRLTEPPAEIHRRGGRPGNRPVVTVALPARWRSGTAPAAAVSRADTPAPDRPARCVRGWLSGRNRETPVPGRSARGAEFPESGGYRRCKKTAPAPVTQSWNRARGGG